MVIHRFRELTSLVSVNSDSIIYQCDLSTLFEWFPKLKNEYSSLLSCTPLIEADIQETVKKLHDNVRENLVLHSCFIGLVEYLKSNHEFKNGCKQMNLQCLKYLLLYNEHTNIKVALKCTVLQKNTNKKCFNHAVKSCINEALLVEHINRAELLAFNECLRRTTFKENNCDEKNLLQDTCKMCQFPIALAVVQFNVDPETLPLGQGSCYQGCTDVVAFASIYIKAAPLHSLFYNCPFGIVSVHCNAITNNRLNLECSTESQTFIDLQFCRDVLCQVANLLYFLHKDCNIVHGDIKLPNVLVDKYGRVYIVDLGCAKQLKEFSTTLFQVVGTKHIRAPESVIYTEMIDLKSLGSDSYNTELIDFLTKSVDMFTCKRRTTSCYCVAEELWSFGIFVYEWVFARRIDCTGWKLSRSLCTNISLKKQEIPHKGYWWLAPGVFLPVKVNDTVTSWRLNSLFFENANNEIGGRPGRRHYITEFKHNALMYSKLLKDLEAAESLVSVLLDPNPITRIESLMTVSVQVDTIIDIVWKTVLNHLFLKYCWAGPTYSLSHCPSSNEEISDEVCMQTIGL